MKFKIIFTVLIFTLIFQICTINCKLRKNLKNQNQNDDDDEFAEFDNLFDDETESKDKQKREKDKQKINLKEEKQVDVEENEAIQTDFAQFDAFVEETNDDDEIDNEFEKKSKEKNEQILPTTNDAKTNEPTTTTQKPTQKQQQQQQTKQAFEEDETLDSEEFENFIDDEEFEGYSETTNSEQNEAQKTKTSSKKADSGQKQMPNLKIADVPQHLLNANGWQNFYWEFILILGLIIYCTNIFIGKNKNYSLANAWFHSHRELLERNFVLIGDDGDNQEIPSESTLIKECENLYGLWCSGRQSCLSMYVQLKFLKRQDLISLLTKLVKPMCDQIIINVEFERDDVDSYVFCLANRKQTQILMKDYQDLGNYCVEKKAADKFDINSKYVLLNELGEVPSLILDTRVCTFLNKHPDMVEYLLISDQHIGYKSTQQNEQSNTTTQNADSLDTGIPNSRSVMIICFNVPGKGSTTTEDIEKMQPALLLTFYLIDKIARIRISKEAKAKALKKRKEVTEAYLKATNKQRQEAAQLRKEEKRRAEKEKIMNESDPEKQKKLEEKELKREKKRSQPKFKQVKIKSM